MVKKRVALVFGKKALFVIRSPISFLMEANFQKAIGLLENRACDFVYVVLDHLDHDAKQNASRYLDDIVLHLDEKIQVKIFISASSKCYIEMFTDYIRQIPDDVCVSVMASFIDKKCIQNELSKATLKIIFPTGAREQVILLAAD